MTYLTLGIDISKDRLDAHLAPTGETRKFPNGKAGFKSLLTWLKGRPVSKVVYEPTGCWHRNFEQALIEAGLALAQMGMAFDLRQTTLLSPRQRQLKELQLDIMAYPVQ